MSIDLFNSKMLQGVMQYSHCSNVVCRGEDDFLYAITSDLRADEISLELETDPLNASISLALFPVPSDTFPRT